MKNEAMSTFNKKVFLIAISVFTGLWLLSWLLPWTIWIENFPWARLVISFIVFVAPGMAISLFLSGQRFNLATHFTMGIAISVLSISLLGLMGRIIQVPFDTVKTGFALVGFISLLGFILFVKLSDSAQSFYKPQKFSWVVLIVLLFLMVLAFCISYLFNTDLSGLEGDNFTYEAYLTNWQHAQPLGFKEIIYGSGTADWIRFWLALFPMTTALLASMSNLHGILLLGVYLQPFLVAVSILSIYNLYQDFIQSKYIAISAILLHIACFFILRGDLQTGSSFLYRLSEDKAFAAFIIAPMFFLSVRFLLEKFTWRSILFFLLVGTSLEFLHPVILAYSIFIAGLYAVFVIIAQKDFKKLIVISILLVSIILPAGSLRFVDAPWVSKNLFGLQYDLTKPGAFDLDYALQTGYIDTRISYIKGTPFYGFNPERIQFQIDLNKKVLIFISWSYLWVLLIGLLWSVINIKKNPVAPFITATSLFILVCLIPYTGWLVGYLVSARLLWRAPWLFPIGLIGVVLLAEFIKLIYDKLSLTKRTKISIEQTVFGLTLLLSAVMFAYFFTHPNQHWRSFDQIDRNIQKINELAEVGEYLEKNVPQPAIFVSDVRELKYLLPGLSSKAKIVYFRNTALSPYPVNLKRIDGIFSLDMSVTFDQRMETIKQYHAEYFLTRKKKIKDFFILDPRFVALENINGFWLLHFQEKKP